MNPLRTIWAMALLDLQRWLKTPAAIISALLPPLGMAILLAVLSMAVTEQPVALVVQSYGPYAARMEKLIRADEEGYFLWVTDAFTAERLLAEQQVAAIITIPPDFDRKAAAYEAVLHLKLNNVHIDFSDDIRRSVDRAAGQFDVPGLGLEDNTEEAPEIKRTSIWDEVPGTSQQKEEEEEEEEMSASELKEASAYQPPDRNPYHIKVEEHDLRVTDVDFLRYQLLPVLVLLVLNVGMTGTALHCAGDGERGTARLLVLAPVSSWALVSGRLLGGLLTTLAVLIPLLGLCLATHIMVVPAHHWPALLALFLAIALCASGLGSALGTLLRGGRNVAMASSILVTYLFLMGGGFTTIAFLPRWLRILSAFDPMRYAIDGLREALFYPNLTGFATDLAVLTGTAFVSVLLGSVLVVRSWRC